jgi:hypothetical protein
MNDRRTLLTTIARCPVVEMCLNDRAATHPCSQIVLHQWPNVPFEERLARWPDEHQVPEPWVGHLDTAPLLFLSSNPSLGSQRQAGERLKKQSALTRLGQHAAEDHPALAHGVSAPVWTWKDPELVDRFESAFEVFMTPDGTAAIDAFGKSRKTVHYWREIKKLADHLYGPANHPVRPGIDYALTEVVHCKSSSETGVARAVEECAPRYLSKTLAASAASVIVVVGRVARQVFRIAYNYSDAGQVSPSMLIEGRERVIVFVGAPNSRKSKYPRRVPEADAGVVRALLAAQYGVQPSRSV